MNNTSQKTSWFPKVMLLSAGHFITDMYPGYLAPVLPLLIAKFGFSLTFAALLTATSSFSTSLMQTVFGYLSDRFSLRLFIILGPVISALFYSSIGYIPDKWVLVFCLFLGGCGVAQFHPLAAKLTNQVSERHKGKAMSVFVTGGSIGYAVGPLVITAIIAFRGIDFAPVLIIPAFILAYFMYRFAPNNTISRSFSGGQIKRSNFKQITSVGIYVVLGALRGFVIMGFCTFIPILFSLWNYPLESGGFAIFIFIFMGAIGGLLGGFLTDRFSPKKIIAVSFLPSGPALLIFLHSGGLISYIALGIAGFLLYLSIPAVITQAQAAIPVHVGMVSSMVMGFAWGLGGIMVLLIGRAADIFGLLQTLNVLAFVPFIGFILSLFLHIQRVEETRLPEYI